MPFVKGKVANPKGAGIGHERKKQFALELLGGNTKKAAEIIEKHLNSGVPEYEQWAAKIVLEYVCGKPTQQVDANVAGGFNIIFSTPTKLT